MARRDINEQITLEDGGVLELVQAVDAPGSRRGAGSQNDPVVGEVREALRMADFAIVGEFKVALSPTASARPTGRRRAPEAAPAVQVAVGADEGAVLLLELADGVFVWDSDGVRAPTPGSRRGTSGRDEVIRFELASQPGEGRPQQGRRGVFTEWILDRLIEPARVYVLRFLAAKTIDALVERVEDDMFEGPIQFQSADPETWIFGPALYMSTSPQPTRLLLLLHGTFSSTLGSFGQLAATAAGRTLLEKAIHRYDLVLGFNHLTLAKSPEENAAAILKTLKSFSTPGGLIIDAIAFSRGGLVYRALAEELIPKSLPDAVLGKAIFVGCTNGGTNLASPENWAALVDIYTNVAIASARAIGALTGGAAGPVLTFTLKTIGRFVQLLSQVAITDRRLPGLAAMEPGSDLVERLNRTAPDAMTRHPAYRAITSSFEPGEGGGRGLAAGAARFLIDRVADRLMGEPNDLVVNTRSMTAFGTHQFALPRDGVLALGDTADVYHTVYFGNERIAGQLLDWLELREAPQTPEEWGDKGGGWEPVSVTDPFALGYSFPVGLPGSYESWHGSHGTEDPGDLPDLALPDRPRRNVSIPHVIPYEYSRGGISFLPIDRRHPLYPGLPDDLPEVSIERRKPAPAAEPVAEPGPVDRFVVAEMEPYPALGIPVNLWVAISAEPVAVAAHQAADATDVPARLDARAPLRIEIIPRRNCSVVGDAVSELDVTPKKVTTHFQVQGLAAGEAELIVEARQGVRLAASFLLKPIFVDRSADTIRKEQPIATDAAEGDGFAVLRIYEFEEVGDAVSLRFDIVSDEPLIANTGTVRLRSKSELILQVSEILREVEDAWNLRGEGDREDIYRSFLARIKSKAKVRTERLIPEKIRRALWEHREAISAIQVISEEPLIPWELMCVTDPDHGPGDEEPRFLSEWGLIRWLHDAPMPGRRLSCGDGGCRFVIPDYLNSRHDLREADAEKEMLEAVFPGIAPIVATSEAVSNFLAKDASECEILHFACHGLAEQKADLVSHLLMNGHTRNDGTIIDDPLAAEQVKAEARFRPGRPRTLVFVNACQAGREGEGLAGVSGFADAFIRPLSGQGAAAFVGALWSVDDQLARTFAESFYGALKQGETLIEAIAAARKACDARHDFTWLAYTVYGNPFARFGPAQDRALRA